jgi:hypothetical protein
LLLLLLLLLLRQLMVRRPRNFGRHGRQQIVLFVSYSL